MGLDRFNIRVYGLCVNRFGQILVTDERRGGYLMTKFPGGGLDFGEGVSDCLRREFQEELGIEVEVDELFYINDFLQVSAFNPRDQILSVYYWIRPLEQPKFGFTKTKFDFSSDGEDAQTFRWVSLLELQEQDLTFPIDKVVLRLLQDQISQKKCPTYDRLSTFSII